MELEEFEELCGNVPINDLKKIKEYINKNFVSKDKIRERIEQLRMSGGSNGRDNTENLVRELVSEILQELLEE